MKPRSKKSLGKLPVSNEEKLVQSKAVLSTHVDKAKGTRQPTQKFETN